MPRVTRQSAAYEATLSTAATPTTLTQHTVNPPSTEEPSTTDAAATKKSNIKGTLRTTKAGATSKAPKVPASSIGQKRKRTTKSKAEETFDVNELPHGLNRVNDDTEVDEHDLPTAVESPSANIADDDTIVPLEGANLVDDRAGNAVNAAPITSEEKSTDESTLEVKKLDNIVASAKRAPVKKTKAKRSKADPNKPKRVKKANKYGVTLGVTPYPDWPSPTHEQAYEVNRILSKAHGEVRAPKAIPLPSLTVAGCGEVPNILEALMRTLLSAHTTNKNAGTAIQGMIKRYGTLKDGHAKGNVDWNAVRLSSREDVEEAIKHGGLAKSKSTQIWKTVEMVYNENEMMRKALAKDEAKDAEKIKLDVDSNPEELKLKSAALFLADPKVLSLDYMHVMPAEEAFQKFITFPGIGVKTASCTLLFCMQRPSFAVDTHVYRLCQYLGWVPMTADRDTTFAHCDVRIPDELKYSLHQLLIAHGKTCGRCRAITGESSEGWDKGCQLEHLVKRYGAKKGGEDKSPKKAGMEAKMKKKVKTEDGEGDEDDDEYGDENEKIDILGNEEEEYSPGKKAKKLAKATKPKAGKGKTRTAKKEMTTDEVAMKDEPSSDNSAAKKKAKKPAKATKKKMAALTTRKRKASQAAIQDEAEVDDEANSEDAPINGQTEKSEVPAAAANNTGTADDADDVMDETDMGKAAEEEDQVSSPLSAVDPASSPLSSVGQVMADAISDAIGPFALAKKGGYKAVAPKKPVRKAASNAKAPPKKRARKV